MSILDRHRWRDPAKQEWQAADILVGWMVGCAVVLAGSCVYGVLATGPAGVLAIFFYGGPVGIPAHTLYGVPVAIAAATALRRVQAEWVHLTAFAALGALGGLLTVIVAFGGNERLVVPLVATGTAAAVLSRASGKRFAVWSRGAAAADAS